MRIFSCGRRLPLAAVAAVLVGTYAAGNLAGRATAPVAERLSERAGTPAASPAVAPPAGVDRSPAGESAGSLPEVAGGARPAGTGRNGAGGPATGSGEAATGSGEAATGRDGLAARRGGPGALPLPMTGAGPYGTRRTTGAAYATLTFDDGPDPRWTPRVLARLREHRVTATFCVVGTLVEAYPALVRRIVADGHSLCNHTWGHDVRLGQRPRPVIRRDLVRTNAAIRAAVPGARVSYYRQPGGAWTKRVVAVAAELGMSSLHWAVDPQDWRGGAGSGAIATAVTREVDAGEIVLLHDGGGWRHGTVRSLDRILSDLDGRVRLAALPGTATAGGTGGSTGAPTPPPPAAGRPGAADAARGGAGRAQSPGRRHQPGLAAG